MLDAESRSINEFDRIWNHQHPERQILVQIRQFRTVGKQNLAIASTVGGMIVV
jgi:hypothetical protein